MPRRRIDKSTMEKTSPKPKGQGRVITHKDFNHEFVNIDEIENGYKFFTIKVGSEYLVNGVDYNRSFIRLLAAPDNINEAEQAKEWLLGNYEDVYVKIIPIGCSSVVLKDDDVGAEQSLRIIINGMIDSSLTKVDKEKLKAVVESALTEVGL